MSALSSGKNTQLLLVIALAMALLFALYNFVVKPKQEEVQSIRTEVNDLKTEITALEQSLVNNQSQHSQTKVSEFTLRKKVPDNRELDSLILSIEEIEYVTGSRILEIEFNNYDALVADSGFQDPIASDDVETTEVTEESAELPVSTIAVETLPPSLKLVTFTIDVASPNEVNLLKFIQEIEKIERVMHIDLIDFLLPGEEAKLIEGATDVVAAEVQVTTFYYED